LKILNDKGYMMQVVRKFGIPFVIESDLYSSTISFRIFSINIFSRTMHFEFPRTMHFSGGGGRYSYKLFSKTIYKTKILVLSYPPHSLATDGILGKYFCEHDNNLFNDIQNLCENLDDKSRQTVYNIISREREAYLNKKLIVYHLTKEEIDNLKQLKCEFYANIARLKNNIFY